MRIGWLRSVANIYHAFAVQCFADELAHLAGRDPFDYLLDLIGPPRILDLNGADYPNYGAAYQSYPVDTGRLRRVLELAAEKSGWAKRKPGDGTGWGIAVHRSFVSYVATVVQVEVNAKGELRIPRVDMAVDAATSNLNVPGIGLDKLPWRVSSTPAARNSQPYQERRVCAGNTNCIPICPIQAKYDPSVTLAEALRTGNVQVWYRCAASGLVVDESGRVSGLDYIRFDADNGPVIRRGRLTAKIYILAGNAIETPRLLLMSKSERTPNGVANRRDHNGVIGKYLMDHPLYLAWALAPQPVWGYRGPLSTGGIEVCRDGEFRRDRGAFRIEIGNEGWNFPIGDPDTTTVDLVNGLNDSQLNKDKNALFGPPLVKELNDKLSRQFRLGFLIEQSPDDSNTVTLSTAAKDRLGLPRPKINYNLSDYTKQGLAAAKRTATAIFKAMNADEYTSAPHPDDPSSFPWPNGQTTRLKYYGAGHIVGTHRMGTSAVNSAVNDMQQSWDHDNLFLVGSGTFPTVATANPTLTIAGLCLRSADYILRRVLN